MGRGRVAAQTAGLYGAELCDKGEAHWFRGRACTQSRGAKYLGLQAHMRLPVDSTTLCGVRVQGLKG